MTMPGRGGKLESSAYRYGYQGSEINTETYNNSNQYTTEFRQLDPRFGRWFSPDPVFQPHQSPYNSMDGNPINLIDVMGDKTGKTAPGGSKKWTDSQGNKHRWKWDRKNGVWLNQVKIDGKWRQVEFDGVSDETIPWSRPIEPVVVKRKRKIEAEIPTDWGGIAETVFEIGMGFTPIGFIYDIRDLYQALESGEGLAITIALAGFIPGGDLLKAGKKMADAMGTAAKKIADQATVIAKHTKEKVKNGVNHLNEKAKKVIGKGDAPTQKPDVPVEEVVGNIDKKVSKNTLVSEKLKETMNPKGGLDNCVNCALEMQAKFLKEKFKPADLSDPVDLTEAIARIKKRFPDGQKLKGFGKGKAGLNSLLKNTINQGYHSGIILMSGKNGNVGHALNFITNKNGTIKILDGQSGEVMENVFDFADDFGDIRAVVFDKAVYR